MRVVDLIERARTRRRVTVLKLRRVLVVVVALNADAALECLVPVKSRLVDLAEHLIHFLIS